MDRSDYSGDDNWQEPDGDEVEMGSNVGRRWIDSVLGDDGWDKLVFRFGDCTGSLEKFGDAIRDLKHSLDHGYLVGDTDADIIRLARMTEESWYRYVDPALSVQSRRGGTGSVIVLYECADHIYALHKKRDRWDVYRGLERIDDLVAQLQLDETEQDPEEVPATDELPSILEDMTQEDLELRQLHESNSKTKEADLSAHREQTKEEPCAIHALVDCPYCRSSAGR